MTTTNDQQNAPITSQNAPELTMNMGHDDPPAPSSEATAGREWIQAIQQRYEEHDVVYERPARLAACWPEYRAEGRCTCDADGDMAVLIAEVAQLRTDLACVQAERDDWKHGSQHEAEEADQLRAQVQAMIAVVEAAKEVIAESHGYGCPAALIEGVDEDCDCGYRQFRDALAALDQIQRA